MDREPPLRKRPLRTQTQCELEHDRSILDNAEFHWGWATAAGQKRVERRIRMIRDALRSMQPPEGPILELGCGKGVFTRPLSQTLRDLVSCDLSADFLACIRKEGRLPLLCAADVQALPFKSSAFSAAIGISILHHVDCGTALEEVHRVLKPSATIVFTEPNLINPHVGLLLSSPWLRRRFGATDDETAFRRNELTELVSSRGFKDVSVHPFDFLHPWTPRPLAPLLDRLQAILERIPLLREISGSLFLTARKD